MNILASLLSIMVIIYVTVIILNRFLVKSGVKITPFFQEMDFISYIPSLKEKCRVFGMAIFLRLIVFLFSIFIFYVFKSQSLDFSWNDVIQQWYRWDAESYVRITESYTVREVEFDGVIYYPDLAFFPLYPMLLRLVKLVIPNIIIAGMISSSLMYAFACVIIYQLISLDYGRETAKKALILLSIYPFSFFFGDVMTESLFLLLSSLTLYCIRTHQWIWVGFWGCLCAMTRSVGVFLVFPAFIEICESTQILQNIKNIKYVLGIIFQKMAPLLLVPIGTLAYLHINYQITGNPFYFLEVQRIIFFNKFQPFYSIIPTLFSHMAQDYSTIGIDIMNWWYSMFIVMIMYVTLALGVKKHPTMYSVWFLCYLIINTSMTWPISIGRFFSCAIPAFLFWSAACHQNEQRFHLLFDISLSFYIITFIAFFTFGNIM